MKKDDWEKVKQVLEDTLVLPASERSPYLDRIVGRDNEMRSEVERLLAAYESGFLEDSAMPLAAEALADSGLATGQVIGRYKIAELIGTGGMGEVFRADDTELDRSVAFKVLHRDVAEDEERVRRFIQEAKAASALNHPNILTIHEIGSFEGSRYIVSEYVDGATLRDKMHDGLNVAESVEITCQIAAALQAAHSAGIVHRDIKPENVMIRKDGLVKVLDFGLAKLTEADDRPIDASAPLSRIHTSPGLVMGTVAYMSPEQAKGQPVDARTDLWSLGVVLHEMLTGSSPFEGESVTDLVSSIIKKDTPPAHLDTLPPELRPICQKALAKDKDSRYRSAHDLLKDLEGEKKRMEYAIQPTPYISSSSTDDLKTQLIRRRPTLSAQYIVTSVKRHKYATLAAAILVVAAVAGLSVYRYNGATPPSSRSDLSAIDASTTERDLRFSKLPISARVDNIAISPDGKYVAYTSGDDKGMRLLELATSVDTQISSEGDNWNPSFSPDSQFVYYYSENANDHSVMMVRLSIKGGTPVKVIDDPDEGVSFSPDGSTMVFTREAPGGAAVVLANPDGSNQRILANTPRIVGVPRFSPDGKTLACQIQVKDETGTFIKITGISVADGKQQELNDKKWNSIRGSVWLPNGNLIVVARENISDASQLWSISPGGEPKALTTGLVDYLSLSATGSGDVLVTRQVHDIDARDIWRMSGNDPSKSKQVTTSGEVRGRFALTRDGRLVFTSDVSGNPDLWVMNIDGSGRKQLTQDTGVDSQPAVSPDGKHIAFTSNRVKGVQQIFVMDIDGGNVKQLTQGQQNVLASFSPDGKWVYFVEVPSKTIQRVPVGGGDSTLVATSPNGWDLLGIDINKADGRLVYGLSHWSNGWQYKLAILSRTGESKLIDLPAKLRPERPRWAPDGHSIALTTFSGTGGASELWSIPIDSKSTPRRMLDFGYPGTFDPSWTADGKELFVSKGVWTSIPVLIRNVRSVMN